jgi:hypothetical protein
MLMNNKTVYQPIFAVLIISLFAIILLSNGSQYMLKTSATISNIASTNTTTIVGNLTSASPIYQQNSQTYANRVIDVKNGSAKLEVAYSGNGFAKAVPITDMGTVLYTRLSSGAINGTGQGHVRATDGEMVTYTLKFSGQTDKQGNVVAQGVIDFSNVPSGKLAFLSNVKGTVKAEAGLNGRLMLQVWQQK